MFPKTFLCWTIWGSTPHCLTCNWPCWSWCSWARILSAMQLGRLFGNIPPASLEVRWTLLGLCRWFHFPDIFGGLAVCSCDISELSAACVQGYTSGAVCIHFQAGWASWKPGIWDRSVNVVNVVQECYAPVERQITGVCISSWQLTVFDATHSLSAFTIAWNIWNGLAQRFELKPRSKRSSQLLRKVREQDRKRFLGL